MDRTIVTTSHKPDQLSLELAGHAASLIGAALVDRERLPISRLREKFGAENILVVSREQVKLHTPLGEYFFHPSMSFPRVKAIKQGKPDHMVEAMALTEGGTVLDCTLGLGADAIVASYIVGPSGRVVGVESAPELAYLVGTGLGIYGQGSKAVREAMARIEVVCADSEDYLSQQADCSFDVVYFDPMFRVPRERSSSMGPLRGIVNVKPLTALMIKEAIRVARKRVVMKENSFSQEFVRLGINNIYGGRYSPIAFGVIDKQEAGR